MIAVSPPGPGAQRVLTGAPQSTGAAVKKQPHPDAWGLEATGTMVAVSRGVRRARAEA